MTKNEVLKEYRTENGRIVSPGKFEGSPIWLPYFWDLALEEGGTVTGDEDNWISTFMVQSGDVHEFPELASLTPGADSQAISVWEDDSGFVHYEVTSGNDECAECARRFTATKRYKRALCKLCR